MHTRLPIDADALERLCRRYGIRKLSLFGSLLKGTARPDSDVDLLVEFMPGATPTLLAWLQSRVNSRNSLGGAGGPAHREGTQPVFP